MNRREFMRNSAITMTAAGISELKASTEQEKNSTLQMYDYNMGSFQMSWRDEKTGLLNSCADPRRAGHIDGIVNTL